MALKATSSVHEISKDKPPFGSRFLTTEDDVWSQNAWDHVPPPDDQGEKIAQSLKRQRSNPVPIEDKLKYNEKPAKHWDNFYKNNENNFFKDRKWLHNEFPEFINATKPDAGAVTIAEVGCGAGNSVFPLLSSNQNPELRLHAYDYSSHAVKLVQHEKLYLDPPIGMIHASVWDMTSQDGIPSDIRPGTVDIVILVFVLSALHPQEWGRAVNNIHQMLRPGGVVLLRDYGRYDLAQLRFKGGRLLDDNLYIRGDKTRVYFFELDELALIFTGAKPSSELTILTTTTEINPSPEHVEQNEPSDHQGLSESSARTANASGASSDMQELLGKAEILPDEAEASSLALNKEAGIGEPVPPTLDERPSSQFPGQNNEATPCKSIDTAAISDNLRSVESGGDCSLIHELPSTVERSSTVQRPSPNSDSTIHPSLVPSSASAGLIHLPHCPSHPLFMTQSLGIDRRLIINRKRKVKMYRIWMQGRFQKI